jgi:hypothetical protein
MKSMNDHTSEAAKLRETESAEKQHQNFSKWLSKLINEVAGEMGMSLTKVQIVDGRRLGCRDAHLVKIASDGNLISTIIHESEFSADDSHSCIERTKNKIRCAISKCNQVP